MNELCHDCLNTKNAHVMGKCPKLGTHVVIDADNLDRVQRTGHPRLLRNLLAGAAEGLLRGVHIDALRVDGRAAPEAPGR